MAKAEKKEIPQPKHEVILTLTMDEAQTLFDLISGGVNGMGRRERLSDIYHALKSTEMRPSNIDDYYGMITFRER